MKCPKCKNDKTKVISIRTLSDGVVVRKRECLKCHIRFDTYEGCYGISDVQKIYKVVDSLNKKSKELEKTIKELEESSWSAKRKCKYWQAKAKAEAVLLEGDDGNE